MDKFEEIKKLGELRDKGILSEEEFQSEKQKILGHSEKDKAPKKVESLQETPKPEKKPDLSNQKPTEEKILVPVEPDPQPKDNSNNDVKPQPVLIHPEPKKNDEVKKKNNSSLIFGITLIVIALVLFFVLDPINLFKEKEVANNTVQSDQITENQSEKKRALFVITAELNLREKPSVNSEILGSIPFGSELEIIKKGERKDHDNIKWAHVVYHDLEGWIALEINDSKVLKSKDDLNNFQLLYAQDYAQGSEYSKLPVWGYNLIIDDLVASNELGKFKMYSNNLEDRKAGYKNIIALDLDLDTHLDDEKVDYAAIVKNKESGYFKVYILRNKNTPTIETIYNDYGHNPSINMLTNSNTDGYYKYTEIIPEVNAVELNFDSKEIVGYVGGNYFKWADKEQLTAEEEEGRYDGPATILLENQSNSIPYGIPSYFKILYDPRMYDEVAVSCIGGEIIQLTGDEYDHGVKPYDGVKKVILTLIGTQDGRTYQLSKETFLVR